MTFNIELRTRINENLIEQIEFLKKHLNEPSNASLVRRLIQDKYKDVQHGSADSREKQLNIVELERIDNLDDSLEKIVDGSGV